MNISELNTPAELVAANKAAKSPVEVAVEALVDCNYEQSKKVITWLLTNMVDFHKGEAVKVAKGEQEGNLIQWVTDVTNLETALEHLNKVD